MNCQQLNNIELEEVLASLGHLPTRKTEKEAWYLNPFANENQASFKLDISRNQWYLFSEGIGGNNIDFIRKYFKCSISDALTWASEQNFSSFHQQTDFKVLKYEITEFSEIKNWNLKKYLWSRGLSQKVYPYIKEVKFTMNGKKLYAIGLQNQSGGWELRNSFYKGSLGKKDISLITKDSKNIYVFEGFFDALSFVEINENFNGDLLVLNSISMYKKSKEILKNYEEIFLFLDNDSAGEKMKNEMLLDFSNAVDSSLMYKNFKDLNEFLVNKKL